MDRHSLALERSLAAHRRIGARLESSPSILEGAKRRLARWIEEERIHPEWAREWTRILMLPIPEIVERITDPRASDLRQTSPFAGEIPAKERWEIWKSVA